MKIDFIQIGANIGNTDSDILWKVIRKNNWRGIFVEPIGESFELLKKNYSDLEGNHFENVAVLGRDGEVTIYTRSDGIHHRQQASVKRDHWDGRNDLTVTVPCVRLNSLIEKYGLFGIPFELLQIDAEGADYTIITSTDFTSVMPRFVRFESCHMKKRELSRALKHLGKFGYVKIRDTYEDLCIEGEKGIDVMVERRNPPTGGLKALWARWKLL